VRQAIVLAGGKGTRLKPYTVVFPKPMLPIGGVPILETILRQLSFFGFQKVTLSLGYMAALVQSYFDGTNIPGMPTIDYYVESKPLGTSGPVRAIDPDADDFLAMNGDILSTLNLRDLYDFHVASGSILTLAVRQADFRLPLGVVEFDEAGVVRRFIEKPTVSHFDNVGIYIYNRRALSYIPQNERCDVNDLVNDLVGHGEKVSAYRSGEPYYWIDIGQHGDFEKANEEFDKVRHAFPFLG
jgi:NDP-mannose synthase